MTAAQLPRVAAPPRHMATVAASARHAARSPMSLGRSASGSSALRARCLAVPAAAVVADGGGFSTPRHALSDDARPRAWRQRRLACSLLNYLGSSDSGGLGTPCHGLPDDARQRRPAGLLLGRLGDGSGGGFATPRRALSGDPRPRDWPQWQPACLPLNCASAAVGRLLLSCALGGGDSGGCATPRRALSDDARLRTWWRRRPE